MHSSCLGVLSLAASPSFVIRVKSRGDLLTHEPIPECGVWPLSYRGTDTTTHVLAAVMQKFKSLHFRPGFPHAHGGLPTSSPVERQISSREGHCLLLCRGGEAERSALSMKCTLNRHRRGCFPCRLSAPDWTGCGYSCDKTSVASSLSSSYRHS